MNIAFYISAGVAVLATAMAITRAVAVHALLYLIVSLLAAAVVFLTLGAPLVAALEVIVYAGAIMVLFVFVVMLLDLGPSAAVSEAKLLSPRAWTGPAILSAALLGVLTYCLAWEGPWIDPGAAQAAGPKQVGMALFGPYALGVELVALLMLAGVVGVMHLGQGKTESQAARPDHGPQGGAA